MDLSKFKWQLIMLPGGGCILKAMLAAKFLLLVVEKVLFMFIPTLQVYSGTVGP